MAFPGGSSTLKLVTSRLKCTVGQEELPGHVQTGGDGRAEGKDRGLEDDGAEDG